MVKVRSAKKSDEKKISQLYYDLNNDDYKKRKISIKELKFKNILLVAQKDKQVVGFISGTFVNYFNFKQGYIDEFVVDKKFRGKSFGKELLNNLINKFKELKAEVIFLTTGKNNNKAIKLYKSKGFKKTKNPWFYLEL